MAKRYRKFRTVRFTARTGEFLRSSLVETTFKDHARNCGSDPKCRHIESGTLEIARAFENYLRIGKKRASLRLPCPYSTPKPVAQICLLQEMAERIRSFAKARAKQAVREACERIADEIDAYAGRNAMQVIAEAAL
jgi:hypothetical protein